MNKNFAIALKNWGRALNCSAALLAVGLSTTVFLQRAEAQDQYDPPSRLARLGYMQGSVSFEPAGESEWVQAVPNRPMTIGDRLWADQNSRAEVELGSATIHLAANTGFSFLNLDDRTVQMELSSGTVDVRVRQLDRDDIFEIDTPNQAFTVSQPGRYRVEASEDGNYTVVNHPRRRRRVNRQWTELYAARRPAHYIQRLQPAERGSSADRGSGRFRQLER